MAKKKGFTFKDFDNGIYYPQLPLYVANKPIPAVVTADQPHETPKEYENVKHPGTVSEERKNCETCGGTGKNPNYSGLSLMQSWNCSECNVGGKNLLLCEVKALDDSTNENKGRALFYKPAGIWILIPRELGLETIEEMESYAKEFFENTTTEELEEQAIEYYNKVLERCKK